MAGDNWNLGYVYATTGVVTEAQISVAGNFKLASSVNKSRAGMVVGTSVQASNMNTYPGFQAGIYIPRWNLCHHLFTIFSVLG